MFSFQAHQFQPGNETSGLQYYLFTFHIIVQSQLIKPKANVPSCKHVNVQLSYKPVGIYGQITDKET